MPNPYVAKMFEEMLRCMERGGKVWAMTNGADIRVHSVATVPEYTDDGPWFEGIMGGGTPVRFTAFRTSCDP